MIGESLVPLVLCVEDLFEGIRSPGCWKGEHGTHWEEGGVNVEPKFICIPLKLSRGSVREDVTEEKGEYYYS